MRLTLSLDVPTDTLQQMAEGEGNVSIDITDIPGSNGYSQYELVKCPVTMVDTDEFLKVLEFTLSASLHQFVRLACKAIADGAFDTVANSDE